MTPSFYKKSLLLLRRSCCVASLVCFGFPAYAGAVLEPAARNLPDFGSLPLRFEFNPGQVRGDARFIARGPGYTLALFPTGSVLTLNSVSDGPGIPAKGIQRHGGKGVKRARIQVQLVEGNAAPRLTGQDRLPGHTNYLVGRDAGRWGRNIPAYAKVVCEQVYPGIDLVYYGNQGQMEYDFIVAPGADPSRIRLAFSGMETLDLEDEQLVLSTSAGRVFQKAPYIYQEISGRRVQVAGGFHLAENGHVGFHLGNYDARYPLVIDPILNYSTPIGGNLREIGWGVAMDADGHAYVVIETASPDFPTTQSMQSVSGGDRDIIVMKLNPKGTGLIYATYLGGQERDFAYTIAVDGDGNAFVAGETWSPDFPIRNAYQSLPASEMGEAFVAKLNSDGTDLVYSTFVGGANLDRVFAMTLDSEGNAYLAGNTFSRDLPTVNPLQTENAGPENTSDSFIAKVGPQGDQLLYSTYLGGEGNEETNGIGLDDQGNIYVAGMTRSSSFPTVNAFQSVLSGGVDAFVAKISPAGDSLEYSTYLGGNGFELAYGLAVGPQGDAYVTGPTWSFDFPVLNAFQSLPKGDADIFVSKFDAQGLLKYSTYLGGGFRDYAHAIAVDALGHAYVAGETGSLDIPLVDPWQGVFGGGEGDAFVAKLGPDGSRLLFSSYLGGENNEQAWGIALDSYSNVYVTGWTNSPDFPTLNPVQTYTGEDLDAFITKIQIREPDNNFDGDVNSDLILYNHDSGNILVALMENAEVKSNQVVAQRDPTQGWELHSAADFNGDDRNDLLWNNRLTGQVTVDLLDGTTYLAGEDIMELDPTGEWKVERAGDFNGDGKSDLLLFNNVSGIVAVAILDGAQIIAFGASFQVDLSAGWVISKSGDFNGDGKTDLLLFNDVTSETAVAFMDGSMRLSFNGVLQLDTASGWIIQDAADFDRDGKTDILIYNNITGTAAFVILDGVTVISQTTLFQVDIAAGWTLVNTGDFNGDLYLDLMMFNPDSGAVQLVLLNGSEVDSILSPLQMEPAGGWEPHAGKP